MSGINTIIERTKQGTILWELKRSHGEVSFEYCKDGHVLKLICDGGVMVYDDDKLLDLSDDMRLSMCQAVNKYLETVMQEVSLTKYL